MNRSIIIFVMILFAATGYGQTDSSNMTLIDIQKASEQIRAKEKELNDREQQLNALQDKLKAMEEDLASREADLKKMRIDITALINQFNTDSDKDLDQLARVYGSTKPKAAASVLIKMDIEKSASLLRRMTAMNASRIMAEIAKQDPHYASVLTSYMVGDGVNSSLQKASIPAGQ